VWVFRTGSTTVRPLQCILTVNSAPSPAWRRPGAVRRAIPRRLFFDQVEFRWSRQTPSGALDARARRRRNWGRAGSADSWPGRCRRGVGEQRLRRRPKLHQDLVPFRQAFAERRYQGTPFQRQESDEQPQGAEGFDVGVLRQFAPSGSRHIGRQQSSGVRGRMAWKDLAFWHARRQTPCRRAVMASRLRLEDMVLDHVRRQPADSLKAPRFPREILGEGDLDAGHIIAVPIGFQERVGEAEYRIFMIALPQ